MSGTKRNNRWTTVNIENRLCRRLFLFRCNDIVSFQVRREKRAVNFVRSPYVRSFFSFIPYLNYIKSLDILSDYIPTR